VLGVSSAVDPSSSGAPETPALISGLIDDSALFVPREAEMADALRAYLDVRAGERAELLGAFLCQASRLPELITELIKIRPAEPLPLSLIIDTGMGGVPKAISIVESREELLRLDMVEMPAPSDVDEVWLERVSEFVPEDVVRVVEPRRGNGWLDGVRKVVEHGSRPKIRCGGPSVENFPSVTEVADFIAAVNELPGSSFKATNSLHRAVRHTDDNGVAHHGFVNLLVAAGRALQGGDIAGALGCTDGAELAGEVRTMSEESARALRGLFASCATPTRDEPFSDLTELGLL